MNPQNFAKNGCFKHWGLKYLNFVIISSNFWFLSETI